ncbi:nucleoside deaminase [Persicimonas caeni]|uniref:Nucleoside deaminase n=1 Tax=Persicimonas caeni TaxID=2292766 RepID=A0A4Y6PVV5_PERCE|nr:nucleoside deaminase [Persicimonas caeni]QDG52249.1 nucleoside deaminase [Persicimonas caeni]QED33471.1 nucleoside deaminase [Persicimonas caeni]
MSKRADKKFMRRAVDLALASESEGNLPIGCVIVLDGEVIAEGKSSVLSPQYNPGRHAEVEAIRRVDDRLWPRAAEMTCYTTLEPCVMCAGTLLLHGVGRVVFGAYDKLGGAGCTLEHLPPYYDEGGVYAWEGPLMPRECDPLYERADEAFAELPVGRKQWAEPDEPADTPESLLDELHAWRESKGRGSRKALSRARKAARAFVDRADESVLAAVLPYARAIFEETGYLKDFRALERYAKKAGELDVLDEVDETLRAELPDVWIKRALRQGDLDGAIECWFEHEEHSRARLCADPLVRAVDDAQVELLISCRMSQVNYRIGRRKRSHYRRACNTLRRLKDELERAGHAEYWQYVIEDIRAQHDGLPALIDELDKAGFMGG